MPPKTKTILLWALMIGGFLLLLNIMNNSNDVASVSTSEFIKSVESGDIVKVRIQGTAIVGWNKEGTRVFRTTADGSRPELIKTLLARRVDFVEVLPSVWSQVLIGVLPWLLILLLVFWWVNRQNGGLGGRGGNGRRGPLDFGRSRFVNAGDKNIRVRFKDVAGVDEVVDEVSDLVAYLRRPKDFSLLGGRMPKGVLLTGKPGTGKTLLARAIAGEAGVPFLATGGAGFVEMFVGVGAARVRDLFEEARKKAPCIVFIDEIDGLARKRGGVSGGGGHEEREQALNQILECMDGFEPNSGIIVMAATNRPEILDDALMRPGRFDRKVYLPEPDLRGRLAILRVHVQGKVLGPDVDLEALASQTAGLTGAALELIINEAALEAAKRKRQAITSQDVYYAKEKILQGLERKNAVISDEDKRIVAWHEAGHTIIGWLTPEGDTVDKVSIIPRGQAAGLTWFSPKGERGLLKRSYLLATIRCGLGGRAAEEMLLGKDVTTGASNDIEHASAIAKHMVRDWAMSDSFGIRSYGTKEHGIVFESDQRDYSDATAQEIDRQIDLILKESLLSVKEMLRENEDKLRAVAEALVKQETLDQAELAAILGPRPEK